MPNEKRPLTSFYELEESLQAHISGTILDLEERKTKGEVSPVSASLIVQSEINRLLRQQEIVESMIPGEELEEYPPGITVHDVIRLGLLRQIITGSIIRVSGR